MLCATSSFIPFGCPPRPWEKLVTRPLPSFSKNILSLTMSPCCVFLCLCADHLLMGIIDEASNPGAAATFDHFQTDCLTAFDPRSLLDVISSAQCCGGASNGHSIAATSPLSDHSCDASSGGPGATWYQINEQMTDHASGVAFCASQGASLCPRSRYCVQGVGGPPVGGRRSGDKWAPTSDGDNSWIQVGTWGGDGSNTCMFHHDLQGGIYGPPAWGMTADHAGYQGWVLCCE
jgi:hypothetical protein